VRSLIGRLRRHERTTTAYDGSRTALSIDVENIGKVGLDHSTVKAKIKPFIKTKRLPKKKRLALKQASNAVNKISSEGVQLHSQYPELNKP
jgi:hypothetical protein